MARSSGSTLLKIPPCNTARSALHKHEWSDKKVEVTEQRTANVQMSRTVEVVKGLVNPILHKPATIARRQIWWEYSLSRIFTDLIMHNYRSNQSALVTRFRTDLRHQYGIFGGESQPSFLRNATRAGSGEERLFSQARLSIVWETHKLTRYQPGVKSFLTQLFSTEQTQKFTRTTRASRYSFPARN